MQQHQLPILTTNDWVKDSKVKECSKCYKEFTFFNRRHHCRYCGRIFCKSCTIVKDITKGIRNVKICLDCNKHMEDYQRSLASKGNLIKPDKDSSPFYLDEDEKHRKSSTS
mmetsp:Transcript_32321/g.31622  ORF Transcript_32321/g.31622 Transcript_32321/m.31622 type:complete len:111 (+) Transcript_32321:206-538(+)